MISTGVCYLGNILSLTPRENHQTAHINNYNIEWLCQKTLLWKGKFDNIKMEKYLYSATTSLERSYPYECDCCGLSETSHPAWGTADRRWQGTGSSCVFCQCVGVAWDKSSVGWNHCGKWVDHFGAYSHQRWYWPAVQCTAPFTRDGRRWSCFVLCWRFYPQDRRCPYCRGRWNMLSFDCHAFRPHGLSLFWCNNRCCRIHPHTAYAGQLLYNRSDEQYCPSRAPAAQYQHSVTFVVWPHALHTAADGPVSGTAWRGGMACLQPMELSGTTANATKTKDSHEGSGGNGTWRPSFQVVGCTGPLKDTPRNAPAGVGWIWPNGGRKAAAGGWCYSTVPEHLG